MTTLSEQIARASDEQVRAALIRVAGEHRPIRPTFLVPKSDEVRERMLTDLDWSAREHPEDFEEQEAEWLECETCPDTAGYPCPPVEAMCAVLGCEPDAVVEDEDED